MYNKKCDPRQHSPPTATSAQWKEVCLSTTLKSRCGMSMEQQLLRAAKAGNTHEVRRLVGGAERADPHVVQNVHGMTSLLWASNQGHLAVAQYLVAEALCDVDKGSRNGATPLHHACCKNHLSIVQYLVETGGANVEARTTEGRTPLHCASFYGCADIVRYLVGQRQANVNAKDRRGHTPLDRAIICCSNVIRYLLPKTSSIARESLERIWENNQLDDLRGVMVLEKYALGHGLEDDFRRYPVHTLLLEFPLPSGKAFQDSVELFPAIALSILDQQGRLPMHVALSSFSNRNSPLKHSPSTIGLLLEREPRSALARDATTGLYPHESVAVLVSSRVYHKDDCSCLDLIYKMIRLNPQQLLRLQRRAG